MKWDWNSKISQISTTVDFFQKKVEFFSKENFFFSKTAKEVNLLQNEYQMKVFPILTFNLL